MDQKRELADVQVTIFAEEPLWCHLFMYYGATVSSRSKALDYIPSSARRSFPGVDVSHCIVVVGGCEVPHLERASLVVSVRSSSVAPSETPVRAGHQLGGGAPSFVHKRGCARIDLSLDRRFRCRSGFL